MSPTDVRYHLMVRVKGPGGIDRLSDLMKDDYTVGRGDPAKPGTVDFPIPADEFLSRIHFRLVKAGPTYAVENVSPQGTKLNGKALDKAKALEHRDRIEAGSGTTVEYLALTDEERTKELAGGAPDAAKAAAAKAAKPKAKKPMYVVLLGFYGILGIVVLFAMGKTAPPQAPDPGPGPYLDWMLRAPLQYEPDVKHRQDVFDQRWWTQKDTERLPVAVRKAIAEQVYDAANLRERIPKADRAVAADKSWTRALAEHGGDLRGRADHDWYLLKAALEVLGLRGFDNLKAAAHAGEDVAKEAMAVKTVLEARLASFYQDIWRYGRSGMGALLKERCRAIVEAVPDRYQPVRAWASERLQGASR